MIASGDRRLYDLLPSVYRVRDAERGEPLRALLGVIEGELRLLEEDIDRLYDNLFIETCDEWVVPYLGDLLGVRGLREVHGGSSSQRALVANTLGYRRRKGTAAVLEQLARDITGWPARAVEFFELLATTQHVNHVRPDKGGVVSTRGIDRLGPVDGPFESAAYTADVRHVDNCRGRYNIPNVGLFLWRLQSYFVERTTARAVADPNDGRYRFSPLGHDAPLFNRPRTELDIAQVAAEENTPGALRRRPLYDELEDRRRALANGETPRGRYFEDPPVVQVFVEGGEVPPQEILVCDLSDPPSVVPEGWRRPPAIRSYEPADGGAARTLPIRVALDPVLGRLAFPAGVVPDRVEVSYAYGFPGDLGGGPYDRRASVAGWSDPSEERELWQMGVTRAPSPGDDRLVGTLAEAIEAWNALPPGGDGRVGIISIMDSGTQDEPLVGVRTITVPTGSKLAIVAADWPETPDSAAPGVRRRIAGRLAPDNLRPHLRGDLAAKAGASDARTVAGELILDGLLIEGTVNVMPGDPDGSGRPASLGLLRLAHCTLVPGRSLDADGQPREPDRASVTVAASNDRLRLEIDHSIVGTLRLPAQMDGLQAQDSVLGTTARDGRVVPALVSKKRSSVNLTSATPTVNVTIGNEGPYEAVFPQDQPIPNTIHKARKPLEAAIRAAHDSPAFRDARVITIPNIDRLIVLPGIAAAVSVVAAGGDPTASQLGLTPGAAQRVQAMVGGLLPSFSGLSSLTPSLSVTIGREGPRTLGLAGNPDTIARARRSLRAAIRTAQGASRSFRSTIVGNTKDRLVVLPTEEGETASFGGAPADGTTVRELALENSRPDTPCAIAGGANGELPGPPATLERTTIFGPVRVREMILATEVIFTEPVKVERRQTGCVRFSYLPDGSETPRRFRCQPDLAVQEEPGWVRWRVTPSFTSVRYGAPGYARLDAGRLREIRTGAEDEEEMGAYHFLGQEGRVEGLRDRLDEYLRFGLEAGIFLVN